MPAQTQTETPFNGYSQPNLMHTGLCRIICIPDRFGENLKCILSWRSLGPRSIKPACSFWRKNNCTGNLFLQAGATALWDKEEEGNTGFQFPGLVWAIRLVATWITQKNKKTHSCEQNAKPTHWVSSALRPNCSQWTRNPGCIWWCCFAGDSQWKYRHGDSSWITYFDWAFTFGFQELGPMLDNRRDTTEPIRYLM